MNATENGLPVRYMVMPETDQPPVTPSRNAVRDIDTATAAHGNFVEIVHAEDLARDRIGVSVFRAGVIRVLRAAHQRHVIQAAGIRILRPEAGSPKQIVC